MIEYLNYWLKKVIKNKTKKNMNNVSLYDY